jgi:hypothetical protein
MRVPAPSPWLLAVAVASCLSLSVAGCANDEEDDDAEGDDPAYGTTEAAASARWSPPGTRHPGSVEEAGAWNGGRACSGGLRPGARALGAALDARFAAIAKVDGYACRRNTANTSQLSMHGTGRALDIFVSRSGGTAVANYLVSNASALGIQLVIWNRTLWKVTPSGGASRAYGGPNPHTDHIHAELTRAAAAQADAPEPSGGGDEAGGDEGAPAEDGAATGGGGACASDGACNPGGDGSGMVCQAGRCVAGCRLDAHCPGFTFCRDDGQCR